MFFHDSVLLYEIPVICMNGCIRYAVFYVISKIENCAVRTDIVWHIASTEVLLSQLKRTSNKRIRQWHFSVFTACVCVCVCVCVFVFISAMSKIRKATIIMAKRFCRSSWV